MNDYEDKPEEDTETPQHWNRYQKIVIDIFQR